MVHPFGQRAAEDDGMPETALITGYEPYGGRTANPAALMAQRLDGATIAGLHVVGRTLPVTLDGLAARLDALLEELRPALVIALGLAPGEPMIRLERFAVNLADFEIPDNAGRRWRDEPILGDGDTALVATLPLRRIEAALIGAGIPVRVSNTAGTYICNAALYHLLAAARRGGGRPLCGFVHVPYLPAQVADILRRAREGELELSQRGDLASMDERVMEEALRVAVAVSAGATATAGGERAGGG
jgi:pyroglutamyl-peptidase